ncbi:AbrB/MazE/SpoVT family DNA-binding domain-containing protein [Candidatus Woesearchaeota archaeon]|nr:AbrB/MazE/SpoVT family DNA-binding domain-containing protein [Candidatus Woesearchaeota archaeon]
MKTVLADNRGRIVLGTKFLDRYGRKFAVVGTPKEIVLIPIAKDPLAELRKLGKEAGIDKYTLAELKKMAREEAEKEAFSRIKDVR